MVSNFAGLNGLAALIHIYEQTNNKISAKLLEDIKAIKAGTYIDEGIAVDPNTPLPNLKL